MKLDKRILFVLLWLLVSCNLPSETPSLPTPTTTLPVAPPASLAHRTAGFRDALAVADQFFLTLANAPTPPTGQAYQGQDPKGLLCKRRPFKGGFLRKTFPEFIEKNL